MQCCLCSEKAAFKEQRSSGSNGAVESWHYCSECWKELQRQRADTDPEVCAHYKVFLQYLSGHYPLQRYIGEKRMAKILPTKELFKKAVHDGCAWVAELRSK